MLNWDDLKYLARLAETGSLSAAARALAVDHATVGRRIAALEETMGAKLVDRRSGRYVLTTAGQLAVAEAQRMEQAALAVERIGRAGGEAPIVEISVTAPPTMASDLIVPRLPSFLGTNPGTRLRLIAQSRTLSLTRNEADVAIRLSRPEASSLIVRRAGRMAYGLYCGAGYLAATRESDYTFVGLEADMADLPQQVWLERLSGDRPMVFRSDDLNLQVAAARAGMGIAALPVFLGEARGLARVMPDRQISRDVWLTYHEDLRSSPRLATVTRFLADCLRTLAD